MKTPLIALAVALSLTAAPTLAQGVNLSTVTPTLDFPEPVNEPVSKDHTSLNK